VAGEAAVDSDNYYRENAKKIIATREKTVKALKDLGFIVLDSKANFIFAKNPKISGGDFYAELKKKGVLVRHFEKEKIRDFVRITIGTEAQMEVFLQKIRAVLADR
jgi:histidinol-phosphate aminotransferase